AFDTRPLRIFQPLVNHRVCAAQAWFVGVFVAQSIPYLTTATTGPLSNGPEITDERRRRSVSQVVGHFEVLILKPAEGRENAASNLRVSWSRGGALSDGQSSPRTDDLFCVSGQRYGLSGASTRF